MHTHTVTLDFFYGICFHLEIRRHFEANNLRIFSNRNSWVSINRSLALIDYAFIILNKMFNDQIIHWHRAYSFINNKLHVTEICTQNIINRNNINIKLYTTQYNKFIWSVCIYFIKMYGLLFIYIRVHLYFEGKSCKQILTAYMCLSMQCRVQIHVWIICTMSAMQLYYDHLQNNLICTNICRQLKSKRLFWLISIAMDMHAYPNKCK